MQGQPIGQYQESKKFTDWIPILWSYETIGIAIGLGIGAIAGLQLAKPYFEAGNQFAGFFYTATAVVCALIPIGTVIRLHHITRPLHLSSQTRRRT